MMSGSGELLRSMYFIILLRYIIYTFNVNLLHLNNVQKINLTIIELYIEAKQTRTNNDAFQMHCVLTDCIYVLHLVWMHNLEGKKASNTNIFMV